nr:hypothetical protein [Clostridioides difficile]
MSKDVKVKRNKKYDTFSITMELERLYFMMRLRTKMIKIIIENLT